MSPSPGLCLQQTTVAAGSVWGQPLSHSFVCIAREKIIMHMLRVVVYLMFIQENDAKWGSQPVAL